MQNKAIKKGKKSIFKFIFSRKMLLIVAFLANLYLMFRISNSFVRYIDALTLTVITFAAMFLILNRRGTMVIKISWCMLIVAFPLFGIVFYLLTQLTTYISKKRRNLHVEKEKTINLMTVDSEVAEAVETETDQGLKIQYDFLLKRNFPCTVNNDVTFFRMGEDYLAALTEELRSATKYICIESFIISYGEIWDEIHEILKAKAAEGVDVRLMYDGTNMFSDFGQIYAKKLRTEGIKARVFSPLIPFVMTEQNNRDHRKICVVDGRVAFVGGCNIADEYANRIVRFGVWKDSGVRISGPAVKLIDIFFMRMWNADVNGRPEERIDYCAFRDSYERHMPVDKSKGYVIPFADNPLDTHNDTEDVYLNIISTAKKYLYITTPYLVPDEMMISALILAVKRGVDVRIMLPHIPDKKFTFMLSHSYYGELLEGGVRIFEYEPGFVHAKELIADGMYATIGTANLDFRSLYMSYENGVYMYGVPAIKDMEEDFLHTLDECVEIRDEKEVMNKIQFICGRVVRLFAPLF